MGTRKHRLNEKAVIYWQVFNEVIEAGAPLSDFWIYLYIPVLKAG